MMKSLIYCGLCVMTVLPLPGNAVSPPENEVEAFVREFFKTMNNRDAEKIPDYFIEDPDLLTVYRDENDSVKVYKGKLEDFIAALAQKDGNTWLEETSNYEVNTEGFLARVRCDFIFYLNGEIRHCGVNAFHLVHLNGSWKIAQLTDTRLKNCD